MNYSSIKKALKSLFLLVLFSGFFTLVNAQSENTELKTDSVTAADQIVLPESYQETQEQLVDVNSTGTASYNIEENNTGIATGAAEWRSDSNVEELRVYSGSQNGNNVIKTIEVETPPK